MGLDDDASAALPLLAKPEVASYAREAFAAAEELLRDVDDDELLLPTADFYDEGGWIVLEHFAWHLTHASRHLRTRRSWRSRRAWRAPRRRPSRGRPTADGMRC